MISLVYESHCHLSIFSYSLFQNNLLCVETEGGFKNVQPRILSITSLVGEIWTYE